MINSIPKLKELLKNDEIKFIGLNTDNILHGYSLCHIIKDFSLDYNQEVYQNFIDSPVIVINQFIEDSYKPNDKYFIVNFKKTLLIINQSEVNFLQSLFSKKSNVKFYFLSDCQNNFIQNYQNQINQIQCDEIFIEEEIPNFINSIYINKLSKNLISKNIFNVIITSIAGYLIKQSYSKLNTKRDFYFQKNENPNETIFNENDFIELRGIGSGSSFNVRLMYHIEKEEF